MGPPHFAHEQWCLSTPTLDSALFGTFTMSIAMQPFHNLPFLASQEHAMEQVKGLVVQHSMLEKALTAVGDNEVAKHCIKVAMADVGKEIAHAASRFSVPKKGVVTTGAMPTDLDGTGL